MRLCLLVLIVWLGAVTWDVRLVLAQGSTAAEEQDPGASPDPPKVSERELETYYLQQEDGTLKPFFNIPFEEWDQLYKLYKGLQEPDQPPRFVLRSLRLAGEVQGEYVLIRLTAKAVVQADGWVRIPLKMNQALIVPESDDRSSANALLEFDRESGLVWRVKGKAGQQHSLSLQVSTKLRRLGAQTHFELSLPKATTSRLQLIVPETDIETVSNENAFLVDTATVQPGKTRITVDGLGGQLRLVWQKRQAQAPPSSVFSTLADVRFNLDDQQRLRAEAALRLVPSAGSIESFIVRLPPKMRHVPVAQAGADVRLLPSSDSRLVEARSDCEHVEVSLHHSTADARDFRLGAELILDDSEIGRFVDLGGFEVFEAVSQTGTITLAAESDWAFQWSHDSAVVQVQDVLDSGPRQQAVAVFDYSSQPYTFEVNVSRKELRVHVEPRYELTIESDRVLLEGVVSYRLRAGATEAVTLDLSSWQLTAVSINDQQVFETQPPDTSQPIRVPLGGLGPSTVSDFDLAFSAELFRPPGSELTVALPGLEATSQAPTKVIVRHADHLEVVPLPEQAQGLTEVVETADEAAAAASVKTVVYRGWTKPDRLVYAARVRSRPAEVVVSSDGLITLDRDSVTVEQDLTYRVLHQPASQLWLKLPTSVVEGDGFRLSLDAEKANWVEVTKDDLTTVIGVDLGDRGPGTFLLSAAFELTISKVHDTEDNWLTIPLAVPQFDGAGRNSETSLTVKNQDGRVLETDTAWASTATNVNGVSTMQLHSADSQPAAMVRLHVSGRPLISAQDSVVQVAWLQTWITEGRRNDRLVVKLSTHEEQVRFRLPLSATLQDIAVDRRRATSQAMEEAGDVLVRLPTAETEDARTVEIWYSVEANEGPGHYVLDLPQLIGVNWTRRFYWQLVLPRDEHLMLGAEQLNPESRWNWRMPPYGRTPRFDQRVLEQLVGGSEQLPLPESTNRYLFSSQDAVARVQITTASRAQVLLASAVVVFCVGLLLIYVPVLRHPATLLFLCVMLCVLGFLFPHPTIQLAQLSTFGLLFVLLAFAIKWLLARTRTGPAILHGTSLSSIESITASTVLAASEGSSLKSTQTLLPQTSDSASE